MVSHIAGVCKFISLAACPSLPSTEFINHHHISWVDMALTSTALMISLSAEGVRIISGRILLASPYTEMHVFFLLNAGMQTCGTSLALPGSSAAAPSFRPETMDRSKLVVARVIHACIFSVSDFCECLHTTPVSASHRRFTLLLHFYLFRTHSLRPHF